jgi:enolase
MNQRAVLDYLGVLDAGYPVYCYEKGFEAQGFDVFLKVLGNAFGAFVKDYIFSTCQVRQHQLW